MREVVELHNHEIANLLEGGTSLDRFDIVLNRARRRRDPQPLSGLVDRAGQFPRLGDVSTPRLETLYESTEAEEARRAIWPAWPDLLARA